MYLMHVPIILQFSSAYLVRNEVLCFWRGSLSIFKVTEEQGVSSLLRKLRKLLESPSLFLLLLQVISQCPTADFTIIVYAVCFFFSYIV